MLKHFIHRIRYGITDWYEISSFKCKAETLVALMLAITLVSINIWNDNQNKWATTMVSDIADKYTGPLSLLSAFGVPPETVADFIAAMKTAITSLLRLALTTIIGLISGLMKEPPSQIASYLKNDILYRSFRENFNPYEYKPFLILTAIDIYEAILFLLSLI